MVFMKVEHYSRKTERLMLPGEEWRRQVICVKWLLRLTAVALMAVIGLIVWCAVFGLAWGC